MAARGNRSNFTDFAPKVVNELLWNFLEGVMSHEQQIFWF